jgi:hypothetical protein
MKREERLRAALVNIAATADHTDHRYLICGKCMAAREVAGDDDALAKRKVRGPK